MNDEDPKNLVLAAMSKTISKEKMKEIFKTECINVFGNKYRVNCWVNKANPRILYSYFISYTRDSGIISGINEEYDGI
jgi:hypothetical protein